MIGKHGMDVEALPYTAPPGEEGFDMSHAGGENEAFEGLAHQVADIGGYRYIDPRDCRDRTENLTSHWNIQVDCLMDAYLDYHARDSGNGMPNPEDLPSVLPLHMDMMDCPSLNNIELIDLFRRRRSSLQPIASHRFPNETLIYHGYIGCAPMYPTIAISLHTLATFRQSH
ncbi:hypothetical protein EDB19DRAFT_1645644 [Suillus lakei]|nr:hypothetical protein EDB19DRAFT_1645644 [Suillus lakei]